MGRPGAAHAAAMPRAAETEAASAREAVMVTRAGRGRQAAALRFAVVATSVLVLVPLVAGAAEIYLHGFAFFAFRSAGTGETGPGGLREDQGPGQPDAPRPAPSPAAGRRGPAAGRRGPHQAVPVRHPRQAVLVWRGR